MSELQGQMDVMSYLPNEGTGDRVQGTGIAEGYDAEGNLMNVEAQTSAVLQTADAGDLSRPFGAASPTGEGFEDKRLNEIAVQVRTITETTKGVIISAALEIGKLLIEAKNRVPHGRFGDWLAANVEYSERRAQDMMRLYEEYGQGTIPEAFAALDYSKAVALLSAPEDEREALAEKANAEGLSVRQLQAEVKRLKEAAAADQLTIGELERTKSEYAMTAQRAVEDMQADMKTMRGTVAAAEQTAEALRKEKAAAKDAADLAARRASDAVQRANDAQRQLTEAKGEIDRLKAREPERVEVVPPEVEAELERLRAQKPRGEAEVRFRLAFERLGAEFRAVTAILAEVNAEDAEKGAKYAAAVAMSCRKMIEMLGETGTSSDLASLGHLPQRGKAEGVEA